MASDKVKRVTVVSSYMPDNAGRWIYVCRGPQQASDDSPHVKAQNQYDNEHTDTKDWPACLPGLSAATGSGSRLGRGWAADSGSRISRPGPSSAQHNDLHFTHGHGKQGHQRLVTFQTKSKTETLVISILSADLYRKCRSRLARFSVSYDVRAAAWLLPLAAAQPDSALQVANPRSKELAGKSCFTFVSVKKSTYFSAEASGSTASA